VDELGHARALVVRGGVLQRAHVVDVEAVEAVVPADGTITLGGGQRERALGRFSLPERAPTREGIGALARQAAGVTRTVWRAFVVVLALLGSVAGWSARRAWRGVSVGARRAVRASTSAAVWARPRFRTLARLSAAAAGTAVLIVVTLAYALAVASAAFARFVAQEWTRRRSGGASGRVRAIRR
jgi:hypothetical protein